MQITIDGHKIETTAGRTILQVARENGISIPTLCFHEALEPFGACRLCMVEIETSRGPNLVASCAYPCSEGLVVQTASDAVLHSRRITVELLMASARDTPLIRRLAEELGVGEPRFTMAENKCVLCGLCVRVCKEIVGVAAISVVNRGIEKRVSPPFRIASSACIACGTCVLVCPTDAITLSDINVDARTVHDWRSEFDSVHCELCDHHHAVPEFLDDWALLAGTDKVVPTPATEAKP